MDAYFSGNSDFSSLSYKCFCRLDAETKETFLVLHIFLYATAATALKC